MAHHSSSRNFGTPRGTAASGQTSYYHLLDLPKTATDAEIRRAYREKSKLYHPDTTRLPQEVALEQFRQLNQAYAVLSNPDQRLRYDHLLLVQEQAVKGEPQTQNSDSPQGRQPFRFSRSAYLDPQDRPLSSGEVFALFILALTFLACLLLAVFVGVARGEIVVEKLQQIHANQWVTQLVSHLPHGATEPHSANLAPVVAPRPAATSEQSLKPSKDSPAPRFSFSPPQFSHENHE